MQNQWQSNETQAQIICKSYEHWLGRPLLNRGEGSLLERLYYSPFVVLSHGTEADPILNFANKTALELWGMTWDELTRMPSRLTAEPPNRDERQRLLKAVSEQGFIDDYQGVRITKQGRRFFIPKATVWNLLDANGNFAGQAATFSEWRFL